MNIKEFTNGFKNGLRNFGNNINIIINTLLLLMVYLVGVGVTSIVAKLSGKHFLAKKLKKGTYWSELNLKKRDINEYYRQF